LRHVIHRRALRAKISLVIVGVVVALLAVAGAAQADQATSYQENVGHTGFASGGSLDAPPLTQAWSVNLGGTLSYPLIANGMVYVLETDSSHDGPTLDAISTSTGATVWQRPETSGSQLAYDNGQIFITQTGDTVTAVDATTGATNWTETLADADVPSNPIASGGTLYVGSEYSGDGLYALNEGNGKTEWQANGVSNTELALDGTFLYTGGGYSQTNAYDLGTGKEAWEGSSASCYSSYNAFAADGGHVFESCSSELNAATGSSLDTIPTSEPPAIADDTGVFLSGATLEAVNLTTGVIEWQFPGTGLEGVPLIVNDTVYIGSTSGTLYALNLDTGAQVWSTSMGSSSNLGVSALPGMAAADGLLVVPYGDTLQAYQSATPRPGLDLQISSGPTGPTASTNATFTFGSSDPAAEESCQLDGGAWASCSTSVSYSDLADGPHVFAVKTVDPSDGSTIGLASQAWSIDSEAPTTTFTEQPPAIERGYYNANYQDYEFSFTSSESGAQFQCTLDGKPETCSGFGSSSFTPGELTDGSHTFTVTATSPVGTTGPPASVTWTVDNDSPVVTINSSPPNPSASTTATITFSASSTTPVTYQCSLSSNPYSGDQTYTSCSSPYHATGLTPGQYYYFYVEATDEAGNVGNANYTWEVTAPPSASTPNIDSVLPPYTNSRTATFQFSSGTTGESFQCSFDGATPQTCTSPDTFENVADGPHTFDVYGILDGNVGQTPASYSWTVRTTPPTTTIDGDTFPGPGSVAFYFHADETAWFMCEVDSDGWMPCTSPVEYSNLTEGSHAFSVYGTDEAGNVEPPISRQFTITVPATTPKGSGGSTPQISPRSLMRGDARSIASSVDSSTTKTIRSGRKVLIAAPAKGTTEATVVYSPGHHKPNLVLAKARGSFAKSGTKAVRLVLTRAGRKWLAHHRRTHVLVIVTFISSGSSIVVAQSSAIL
jgi:outer membrane protein assembly factor BamB